MRTALTGTLLTSICIIMLTLTMVTPAMAAPKNETKTAIVLANFGTSYPEALRALINIEEQVQQAFPAAEVRLAFTSNIIRKIWHKRQNDSDFKKQYPQIPEQILYVQGPLATVANLQDAGYRTIYVQPTHVYAGEEYQDLSAYVAGLNSITTIKTKFMPFDLLTIGRPALGKAGTNPDYHDDLQRAAKALKADVDNARQQNAALVYMGHGNEYYSTGIYAEFQQVLRKAYPDVSIFIGTVEGFPSLDDVVEGLQAAHSKKVLLKPLMVVAGDHARNDMAGEEDDSWTNVLSAQGLEVITELHGLGEGKAWANIYVEHLQQIMK